MPGTRGPGGSAMRHLLLPGTPGERKFERSCAARQRAARRQSCDGLIYAEHLQEADMIVMFTARRLKPGAWEQFRAAWDPGDSRPPGFRRAHHARNIRDEDEVISFGLLDRK